MPAFRFIGYFLALAACSTLAFASLEPDCAASQDTCTANQDPYQDLYVVSPLNSLSLRAHRHRPARPPFQAAHAQMASVQPQ